MTLITTKKGFMDIMTINKKVSMDIESLDGNAFALIGSFRKHAKRQGWTAEEIAKVTADMQSGDYDNLLQVLISHTS